MPVLHKPHRLLGGSSATVDRPVYLAILDAKTPRVPFHAFIEHPRY